MIPTITDDVIPLTITGPATKYILEDNPNIIPSFLNSIAVLETALANPVIGIIVPAPAMLPILSNMPNPVNNAVIKINVMD